MSLDNPYSSPTAVSSAVMMQPDRLRLREIAAAQRQTNLAVLFYLCLIPANLIVAVLAQEMPLASLVFGFFFLGVLLFGAIAVFRLAALFRGKAVAVLYVIGLLIPLLGLILLLTLSSRATKTLRASGIKVGFLGAKPDAIDVAPVF